MKKYTFNFSRILVSALIATTLGTKTNASEGSNAQYHLVPLVEAMQKHLTAKLTPWCEDFLNPKNKKLYSEHVAEFKAHIDLFDKEIVKPLENIAKENPQDAFVSQAHEAVKKLFVMSEAMYQKLRDIKNAKNIGELILNMTQSKTAMTSQLSAIRTNLDTFKINCEKGGDKPLLAKKIGELQKAIDLFKKTNESRSPQKIVEHVHIKLHQEKMKASSC